MTRADDTVAPRAAQAWLFSARLDALLFGGSALFTLVALLCGRTVGAVGEVPPWLWLGLVVFIDVAHVWSTLFRTYGDGVELRRRPLLYVAAPALAYALAVAAHAVSAAFFWSVLAYVAVWHFVRQQTGWMTLYARRAHSTTALRRLDVAAVLASTMGPVVWWHANLPRAFWWFREDDFALRLPAWCGSAALAINAVVVCAWLVVTLRARAWQWSKAWLLVGTCIAWSGGIVFAPDDLTFTALNVVTHGVPYLALTFFYARRRALEPSYPLGVLLRAGFVGFIALVAALAFGEEALWDVLVWHEHPQFFGAGGLDLSDDALTLITPLLALPQLTHYVLDGFIWRVSKDPSLAERMSSLSRSRVAAEEAVR